MPVEYIVALVPWQWVPRKQKQVLGRKLISLVTVAIRKSTKRTNINDT